MNTIAVFLTLCLFSSNHGPVCREGPITPGAGGPGFADEQACLDGKDAALKRWFDEAGAVYGITKMSGDDYEIKDVHCAAAPAHNQTFESDDDD